MFEKFKSLIKKASERTPFDPSKFNDSLAMTTPWTPLKGGGTNFRTHQLVQMNYNRIEFKATLGAKFFAALFMTVGVAIPAWIGYDTYQKTGILFQREILFTVLFGLLFFGIGALLFYSFAKPVIFDKTKGMYWKGWKPPQRYLSKMENKNSSRISDIHALQLISEFVRSDKSSYFSYELNLVLRDGTRLNVVDHGKADKLREDAKLLADFLGVPVWDAI